MGKLIDLTGRRFGRLVVLRPAGYSKNGYVQWVCRCSCNKEVIISSKELRSGDTKSCGCLHDELLGQRDTTHGESGTRLHRIWWAIKMRTTNPNDKYFPDYGGRGISICNEWKNDYVAFRNWALTNGYAENLSIDRIDNNKGYSPTNCRWSTRKVQANNTRANHYITYKGVTRTIAEWADYLGFSPRVLYSRIRLNWDIEKAFTTPVRRRNCRTKDTQ